MNTLESIIGKAREEAELLNLCLTEGAHQDQMRTLLEYLEQAQDLMNGD